MGGVMHTALLCALVLMGCGASQQERLIAKRSLDERLQTYTTVLSTLRAHPRAEAVKIELDQAGGWLRRAEALSVSPEGALGPRMDLLLDVVDGQLVRIKAELGRQTAVSRLERERTRYEGEMGRFESIRKENARLREGGRK